MKKIICYVLLLTVLLMPTAALAGQPQRFSARISPELELLAGVLTQTTWMDTAGPQGEGNEYYRALRDFFAPYQAHQAVAIAQELTDLGFTFDAPIAFFSHLGPLPELELKYEYSDYVVRRARDRSRLETFRAALKDLAAESDFLQFYHSWEPQYSHWVSAAAMDGEMVVAWLEGFFGKEASEFHLLLAPAMFPAGGYGAVIDLPDGNMISFQVIREYGKSSGSPEFPAGRDLEHLSLHEWGHSFVNPALEAHSDTVAGLGALYRPVSGAMKAQAYTNVHTFMNELVLRAVTTIAAEELYGQEVYETYLAYEKSKSFYFVEDVIGILREYQENRDRYPVFDDFVPVLLERMAELQPPWWHSLQAYMPLLFMVGLATVLWRIFGRRFLQNSI